MASLMAGIKVPATANDHAHGQAGNTEPGRERNREQVIVG